MPRKPKEDPPSSNVPVIKKRPDVAKRKQEAKELSTTVLKTTFNSVIKYPIIKEIVEDVLYDANKALYEAYLFANYHILRTINIYKATKNSDVLQKIDQVFYYKCLSIVSEGSMKRKEIDDIILRESCHLYKFLRQDTSTSDSSNLSKGVFQNLSLQMETNALNFYESRTLKIFSNYLRHRYDLSYREVTKMINDILIGKNIKPSGNIIVQYYIDFFNKFDKPKELKKNEEYIKLIEKWNNDIATAKIKISESDNKYYIESLEFGITELYNKIENVAVYCKNYTLIKDTRIATLLLHKVLEYNERMQTKQLSKYDSKKIKLFSLLPTKGSFTMNHITICNIGLYNIIRRGLNNPINEEKTIKMLQDVNWNFRDSLFTEELEESPDKEVIDDLKAIIANIPEDKYLCSDSNFMTYSNYYWRYLFKITWTQKKKRFSGHIQTDGKAVSVTLQSSKKDVKEYSTPDVINKILKDKDWMNRCLSIDPGYNKVITGVRMSNKLEHFSVSSKKYYHDSKFTESNAIMKHKLRNNPIIREIIENIPSCKTSNILVLEQYICYTIPKLDTLMNFYTTMKIRDLAFKRYCFSKKSIDDITNDIIKEHGSDTIIGFGDFSNNGCIKAVKGPVKIIERALKRKCILIPIDEFRSSKLSHEHQTLMKHRYSHSMGRNGEIANHQIYNVLYCSNNKRNSMSINRDVNAAQNLLEILIYLILTGRRHPAFDRSRKLENAFDKIENQYNFRKCSLKEVDMLSESIITNCF